MSEGVMTMLVEMERWTEEEMVAVAKAGRLAAWREADMFACYGRTNVSLDVTASSEMEARSLVRSALGPLGPQAFLASG